MNLEDILAETGYPVSSVPFTDTATSYITYHMVSETDTLFGDGEAQAAEGLYSVDFFIKGSWRTAVDAIVSKLKESGYLVQSVGPEIYERDTKYYHIPILILEDI